MAAFKELHTYQCKNCHTVAVSAVWQRDPPLVCIQCHCYMRHLWAEPVETPELAALYQRGVVWNPGTTQEQDIHGHK